MRFLVRFFGAPDDGSGPAVSTVDFVFGKPDVSVTTDDDSVFDCDVLEVLGVASGVVAVGEEGVT